VGQLAIGIRIEQIRVRRRSIYARPLGDNVSSQTGCCGGASPYRDLADTPNYTAAFSIASTSSGASTVPNHKAFDANL
jgi:hypothetical protein